MEFLIVLAASIAAVFALRNPIKKAPIAFYALAVGVVVLLFAGSSGLFGVWWKPIIVLVQRCMLALALFTVVMYIGVLPDGSKAKAWLRPIRAELSIIAWILCMGHMCMYAVPYAQRALSGTLGSTMLLSFCIAAVLFALLLLLGFTSFNFVKQRMSSATWKAIQRLAYPFFALVFAHLVLMLAPAALRGGEQAQTSVAVYSAVFVLYATLRLYRAWRDRAVSAEKTGMGKSAAKGSAPVL